MKLLIIEDEKEVLQDLKNRFLRLDYVVDVADNAQDGRWLWQEYRHDAVLLDVGLPGESGLTLLKERRASGDTTPVIILTARNAWHERVAGLNAGADDYLGKPFYFEELLARVQALLRRRHSEPDTSLGRLQVGALTLDTDRREVCQGNTCHRLTATEFRLLKLLMSAPGKVFSKQTILTHIADQHYDRDPNVIEVYVRRLRKLLGPEWIETLRGQGYRFRALAPDDQHPDTSAK